MLLRQLNAGRADAGAGDPRPGPGRAVRGPHGADRGRTAGRRATPGCTGELARGGQDRHRRDAPAQGAGGRAGHGAAGLHRLGHARPGPAGGERRAVPARLRRPGRRAPDPHREPGARRRGAAGQHPHPARRHRDGRAVRRGDGPDAVERPALRAAHAGRAVVGWRPGGRRGADRRSLGDRAGPDRAGRPLRGRRPAARQHDHRHRTAAPGQPDRGRLRQLHHLQRRRLGRPGQVSCSAGTRRAGRARSCCTGSPARAPRRRSAPTWRKSQGHSRRAR